MKSKLEIKVDKLERIVSILAKDLSLRYKEDKEQEEVRQYFYNKILESREEDNDSKYDYPFPSAAVQFAVEFLLYPNKLSLTKKGKKYVGA